MCVVRKLVGLLLFAVLLLAGSVVPVKAIRTDFAEEAIQAWINEGKRITSETDLALATVHPVPCKSPTDKIYIHTVRDQIITLSWQYWQDGREPRESTIRQIIDHPRLIVVVDSYADYLMEYREEMFVSLFLILAVGVPSPCMATNIETPRLPQTSPDPAFSYLKRSKVSFGYHDIMSECRAKIVLKRGEKRFECEVDLSALE